MHKCCVLKSQVVNVTIKNIYICLKIGIISSYDLLHYRSDSVHRLQIDLTLLRPLWRLYNKLSNEQVEAGTVVPPVVRALTEFFLTAEDLAMVCI